LFPLPFGLWRKAAALPSSATPPSAVSFFALLRRFSASPAGAWTLKRGRRCNKSTHFTSSGTSTPHAAKHQVQEGKALAEHKQTESGGQ
jgi:hypothetical protein